MKPFWITSALIALATAGTANAQIASEAEKHAAMESLRLCLVPKAASIDDHMSDASTIAAGLSGSCPEQWQAVLETVIRGETNDYKASIAQQWPNVKTKISINAVLAARRGAVPR